MKAKDKQKVSDDLDKAFYKVIGKMQDLSIYVENKANDLANNHSTKKYQVYFRSLDRLNAMAKELETFTKELKATVRSVK